MQDQITKHDIFVRYNTLRARYREMGHELGRVNRGLGLAQRVCQASEYQTTTHGCNCRDSQYRPWEICKHRLALLMRGGN